MKELISKSFKTPLGNVICSLRSSDSQVDFKAAINYENGHSEIFITKGYQVELIEFKIRQPLYNGETVLGSNGWIWRIRKNNYFSEKLETSCFLQPENKVEFHPAYGEHLDAIEAWDKEWTLHIGTEDGEILNQRAQIDDWFPNRLMKEVSIFQSITKCEPNGLFTSIPELQIEEKLHIQYLTAYSK